jgi:hypothetical protein
MTPHHAPGYFGPSSRCAVVKESFQHYMKQEGTKAGRGEFVGILEAHLKDRGFCSDMELLLRTGISYNPQSAGSYIKANLLISITKISRITGWPSGIPDRSN